MFAARTPSWWDTANTPPRQYHWSFAPRTRRLVGGANHDTEAHFGIGACLQKQMGAQRWSRHDDSRPWYRRAAV